MYAELCDSQICLREMDSGSMRLKFSFYYYYYYIIQNYHSFLQLLHVFLVLTHETLAKHTKCF